MLTLQYLNSVSHAKDKAGRVVEVHVILGGLGKRAFVFCHF